MSLYKLEEDKVEQMIRFYGLTASKKGIEDIKEILKGDHKYKSYPLGDNINLSEISDLEEFLEEYLFKDYNKCKVEIKGQLKYELPRNILISNDKLWVRV